MLQLKKMHDQMVNQYKKSKKRYLSSQIDWSFKAICIYGARGVGKTTIMIQHYFEVYNSSEKALYISADNIYVITKGLLSIAEQYFALGGEALFIDEVHKYPDWSLEIKNIIDLYADKKIIVSGSSSIDLQKGKGDLSRRMLYYELKGLSFREFLNFETGFEISPFSLKELHENHSSIASEIISDLPVLKHFKNYLDYGYYPYYIENRKAVASLLLNVIEKVIYEDIAVVQNLSKTKLPAMKKLIWLIASSKPFTPNLDKISKDLNISREYVYLFMEYLEKAGIFNLVKKAGKVSTSARKPEKIYINNSSLLLAASGMSGIDSEIGTIRETFFVNQLSMNHTITIPEKADFFINDSSYYEVGGRNKTRKQIVNLENSYVAADDIEAGFQNIIPLYLFGFLY